MSRKPGMEEESHSQMVDELRKHIKADPRERNWSGAPLRKYQNFWCPSYVLKSVVSLQNHFEALDTDIILGSPPNSGTTWLKSLLFSICSRHVYKVNDSPLLSCNPHELVPSLELDLYLKNESPNVTNNIASSSPRVLATHVPYDSLPPTIRTSKCKIVYICRNPLDYFISHWHFMSKLRSVRIENAPMRPLEEAYGMFCQGIHSFGPFWDHFLGYWKASLQTPEKVLFMKYEEMKKEPTNYTKILAQFIGLPFNAEEENEGMVDDIVRMCSFENLKNLDVNKKGKNALGDPNSAFFRKGDVGDWTNFLKLNEDQQLKKIVEEKLKNSGLSF